MSAPHHGSDDEQRRLQDRFLDQLNRTARRSYPAGRMGAEDDGELAMVFATDRRERKVIIRFGKPVEWVGLGVDNVRDLVERLNASLVEIATGEPAAKGGA